MTSNSELLLSRKNGTASACGVKRLDETMSQNVTSHFLKVNDTECHMRSGFSRELKIDLEDLYLHQEGRTKLEACAIGFVCKRRHQLSDVPR